MLYHQKIKLIFNIIKIKINNINIYNKIPYLKIHESLITLYSIIFNISLFPHLNFTIFPTYPYIQILALSINF